MKLQGYKTKGQSRWLEEFPPFDPSESIAEILSQLAGSKDYREPSKYLRGLCGVIHKAEVLGVINSVQCQYLLEVAYAQIEKLQGWLTRAGVDLSCEETSCIHYIGYLVALYHKHCETPGFDWIWKDGNLENHIHYFRTSGMGTKYWHRVASELRKNEPKNLELF